MKIITKLYLKNENNMQKILENSKIQNRKNSTIKDNVPINRYTNMSKRLTHNNE